MTANPTSLVSPYIKPDIKVLVVDDMTLMRKAMTNALNAMGIKDIVTAENGADALALLEKENSGFGLVVSDWNMPVLNGLEFLKKVRSQEKFKTLPFVMCTLESERGHVIHAVKEGVSQYIIKPFTNETFKEKIESVFAAKK